MLRSKGRFDTIQIDLLKQHIIIKLKQALPQQMYWGDIKYNKSDVAEYIEDSVDSILSEFGIRVWVTMEYRPANLEFNREEQSVGF